MHIQEDPHTTGVDGESARWRLAVASGILGWVLDAFDFFVVIFLFDTLADHLLVQKKAIVWTISITLAMRPVGALLFGALADRFGRRKPLIVCVLYFSTITILTGFAPNFMFYPASCRAATHSAICWPRSPCRPYGPGWDGVPCSWLALCWR